jgi:hypothetical protein
MLVGVIDGRSIADVVTGFLDLFRGKAEAAGGVMGARCPPDLDVPEALWLSPMTLRPRWPVAIARRGWRTICRWPASTNKVT